MLNFSLNVTWSDKRYIKGNERRKTECPSNYVVWNEDNQFWVPNFFVWDTIETVFRSAVKCNADNNHDSLAT